MSTQTHAALPFQSAPRPAGAQRPPSSAVTATLPVAKSGREAAEEGRAHGSARPPQARGRPVRRAGRGEGRGDGRSARRTAGTESLAPALLGVQDTAGKRKAGTALARAGGRAGARRPARCTAGTGREPPRSPRAGPERDVSQRSVSQQRLPERRGLGAHGTRLPQERFLFPVPPSRPRAQRGAWHLVGELGWSADRTAAGEHDWTDEWKAARGERAVTAGVARRHARHRGTGERRQGRERGLPRATARRPVAPRRSVTPDEEARRGGGGAEGRALGGREGRERDGRGARRPAPRGGLGHRPLLGEVASDPRARGPFGRDRLPPRRPLNRPGFAPLAPPHPAPYARPVSTRPRAHAS